MTTVEEESENAQEASAGDLEQIFSMISRTQLSRMDEQRCTFEPSEKILTSPNHTSTTASDAEPFLKRPESRRIPLDDEVSEQLCDMVTRAQSSRMEDQRCFIPILSWTQESPVVSRKARSRPASPTHLLLGSDLPKKGPIRSASFSLLSTKERRQNDSNHQGFAPGDQEQFFAMISKTQLRRMDEQRCRFDPSQGHSCRYDDEVSEQLCDMVTRAQASRMEDQRCFIPIITWTKGTPVLSRKADSRPPSPTQASPDSEPPSEIPPRSASSSPVPETELTQSDLTAQVQNDMP